MTRVYLPWKPRQNRLSRLRNVDLVAWLLLITFLALVPLMTGCLRHPSVREFPRECPSGWRFLYRDQVKQVSVCEREEAR